MNTNTPNIGLPLQPIRYRDWLISTKVIDRKLWLQWQHPNETFPRYSYPVTERGLADTIHYARFLIDLTIKLEEKGAGRAGRAGRAGEVQMPDFTEST